MVRLGLPPSLDVQCACYWLITYFEYKIKSTNDLQRIADISYSSVYVLIHLIKFLCWSNQR